METIADQEALTNFSQLLERVAQGSSITITRQGVPVAVLVPPEARDRQKVAATIARIGEFRKNHTLGPDLTVRGLIEEGRR
ncbi:MAG: type II toxin-antitoxin system prevent-host-death family antitoxin [Candidatus Hydrogenedentes bacterium]|nr:type II toxin-antitoxin system prevent-host-death family antitoxin [Candidatus Hydrogenedentota bacterium]